MTQSSSVHQFQFRVFENDLDSYGHLNHAVYFYYLEQARWDWMTSGGYGLKKFKSLGQAPIIVDAKIRFRREILVHQPMRVESQFLEVDRKFAMVEQKILFDSNQKVAAEAEFRFTFMDLKSRSLVAPPAEWLQAIGAKNFNKVSEVS